MASGYRLPSHVRPERYELQIELDPERSRRYRGRVRIELQLERKVAAIELHAVDLKLGGARIETSVGSLRARVEALPEHEIVRVVAEHALAAGKVVLELRFWGRLRHDLRGLYFARSGKRRYAFTQLEAADARRFFPCFDEPAMKARFTLEVVTHARHAVLSNAPEEGCERVEKGQKRVRFAQTPLLSTYLVALAVGDLRASRVVRSGKTPIRVWHVPGQERFTDFALEAARECLSRLTRYFGVPYAYHKLDLVAVPDFDMGAMENAGAVFFRETLLLIDERRATLPEKKRAAEVICHELAHMWYGNLVTMAWWDDLWLNEAFATWMAFDIVDKWRPELRMWNDFGHARSSALALDALRNTHPIYTRVRTPEQATQSFDLITYEKGAAVIRMLERYLGPARFARGVRDYIRTHAHGNATAADLWHALERHAGQAVSSVVRPWVERAGFPLLRVRAELRGGHRRLVLEQARFSARGPAAAPRDPPWPVPVVLKLGTARGERVARHLLLGRKHSMPWPRGVRFVYANADEGGFFRPLHDATLLRELAAAPERLTAGERLGLITHGFAHVHAGYASLESFLGLCEAFGDEPDPDVLSALYTPLWHLLDRVAPAAGAEAPARVRAWIASVFGPALRRIGFRPRRSEAEHERLRRGELLSLVAVLAEDPEIVAEAERRLTVYLRRPGSLEANLVGSVVVVGARLGGTALWTRYLERSHTSRTPQERKRFRMALAEQRDEACVLRTLALCSSQKIPTQDIALLLARMLDNPFARDATWRHVTRNWRELERRMPAMLAGRLVEATPALQTEAKRREVMAFFARHPVPSAARALKQANERFRLDAALRKRAAPVLREWLAAL